MKISVLQEVDYLKNTVALTFPHIYYLDLMYSQVAWVLVFSRTQIWP